MSDSKLQAQIDAASAYEQLFVPALFRQWPSRIIAAAGIRAGERVLDVACGTGVLAREVASLTGPGGSIAGVDPNPGMLAVAAKHAPAVEWREGVAESLPYSDESFDAVVSQFGLMFFRDRTQALREMLRVLVPSGRLSVAVWNVLSSNPAYYDLVDLLDRVAGARAANALRAPFVLGDRNELCALAAAAGLKRPEIRTHRDTGHFPSIRSMVEAEVRGWLPVVGVELSEEQIGAVLVEAERALRKYVTPSGTVAFALSAHIMTGARLRENQID